MTRKEIFEKVGHSDDFDNDFDEWDFLSMFHPNYNCDNIAWEGDIEKYLSCEGEPGDCSEWVGKAFPDEYDAEVERLRLYCKEMLRAIDEYYSMRYPSGILPY